MSDDRNESAEPIGSAYPVLTGIVGTNADLFPSILKMYVVEGAIVADVTYGRGVFWRNVDQGKYQLKATDLQMGVDFRALPYEAASIDALILDPPYMHGGATVKDSINQCYKNQTPAMKASCAYTLAGYLKQQGC